MCVRVISFADADIEQLTETFWWRLRQALHLDPQYVSKNTKEKILIGWLVGWVLWHINLFRLFNVIFCPYLYAFNQRFLNEYLVGTIFYKQDFIRLYMIHQF